MMVWAGCNIFAWCHAPLVHAFGWSSTHMVLLCPMPVWFEWQEFQTCQEEAAELFHFLGFCQLVSRVYPIW